MRGESCSERVFSVVGFVDGRCGGGRWDWGVIPTAPGALVARVGTGRPVLDWPSSALRPRILAPRAMQMLGPKRKARGARKVERRGKVYRGSERDRHDNLARRSISGDGERDRPFERDPEINRNVFQLISRPILYNLRDELTGILRRSRPSWNC